MTIHEWRQLPPLRKQHPTVNGARCGFPSGRREDGLCGRIPVAAYVNQRGPGVAWRCRSHDHDVVKEAAERMGYARLEMPVL